VGGLSAPGGPVKLSVRDLRKVFDGRGSEDVVALDGVDFEIAEKEFVTVIGTSGCGKSTMLSTIAGLEEETDGVVLVDDEYVAGPGRDRGVVFQSYTLFPWLTAQKNVEFALRGSGKERAEVAREHLDLVGLERFAGSYPSQLSGGMRQRVAIARALSYKPEVLLMDEPFGALDAQTRQLMQELLTKVWEEHRLTVMFVTHDIDEAVFLSDRVLVMTARPGRIKEELTIGIERPRTFEILSTPEFFEYKSKLLTSVREESLRSAEAMEAIT
jgi:NitT/TauT family transport system ATP-binding protein